MAGRPKVLTPEASPRDRFGAELRAWRERRGFSQRRLADMVLHSEEMVAKVERAERWPTWELAKRCDAALIAEGALLALWPAVEKQRLVSDGRRHRKHTSEKTAPPTSS